MADKKNTVRKRGRPPKSVINNKPSREILEQLYEQMILIRRFEEKAGQLYGMGHIGGFCHLYIGQEAVVVGMQSMAEEGDSVVTSYRDHGHMLACGMESRGVMAELTGRKNGYSRGKGGSMHMFSREKNFYGGHGIVAAQVPIGAGLAFAHKYKGDGGVNMAYLGDGAANQGQVYETFNMSALWKLPVIFVIENNQYGMGTSVSRAAAGLDLADRGKAYGIPEQGLGIEVTEKAKLWIGDHGYDPQFGARPLKRLIQDEVHNRLAEAILDGLFNEGDIITVDLDPAEDRLIFTRNGGEEAQSGAA